jgi:hypothetical protein
MTADDAKTAAGLLDLSEQIKPIIELVAGYRKQCEVAGFSPTAAEAMAVQYNALILVKVLGGKKK